MVVQGYAVAAKANATLWYLATLMPAVCGSLRHGQSICLRLPRECVPGLASTLVLVNMWGRWFASACMYVFVASLEPADKLRRR
eukprot:5724945-Lingulodinium_polyedra.AAC.1